MTTAPKVKMNEKVTTAKTLKAEAFLVFPSLKTINETAERKI